MNKRQFFYASIALLSYSTLTLHAQVTDDANLINITTLEQLDAMRYDLDGDGLPSAAGRTEWNDAFSMTASADGNDNTPADGGTITGYELNEQP